MIPFYKLYPQRHLSGTWHNIGGRPVHYRDALVVDMRPEELGLKQGENIRVVAARLSECMDNLLSPERVVLMRSKPRILAILLEHQPGVHPPVDLTLREIIAGYRKRLSFRPRQFSFPVTRKREGEQILSLDAATVGHSGGGPCRRIVFHFSKIQVGIGDRLIGLASIMVLARVLGAEVTLDSPFFPDIFDNISTKEEPEPLIYDLDFLDNRFRYHRFLAETDLSSLSPVVHAIGNECFHYGLYQNPYFRKRLGNFDIDLRRAYREIFSTILHPGPALTNAVTRILSLKKNRELVGVQLRTGLIQREFPFYSRGDVVQYCHRIVDALPGPPNTYLSFITADDNDMAALARATFESLGIAAIGVDAPVLHISYGAYSNLSSARLKLVTDLLVLSACDRLFFSLHSNFGRTAFLAGNPVQACGLYGRNFDLVPLTNAYMASSKHLLFNDAIVASMGGLLGFRYHGEYGIAGTFGVVARAMPDFGSRLIRSVLKKGCIPAGEVLRLFMEALHRSEDKG